MPSTILGKVVITPKGEYSSAIAYKDLDVVTYQGSSYLAIQDTTAGILPTNTAYWLLLAQKGDTGDAAGFGTPTAEVTTLPVGQPATVSIVATGTDTSKVFSFVFGIPTGATGNGIASIAKTGTSGNVDTYTITYTNGDTFTFDVTNGEVTLDYLESNYATKEEIENGSVVAGQAIEAESIKTALGVLDNTPFSCQPSGGDADITSGYQKLNKLVGVKVVDNQGINKSTIAFVNATTSVSGEQITITASTTSGGNIYSTTGVRTREANHKYLVLAKASHQWAIQTGTSEYKTFDAGVIITIITQSQRNPNLFPLWGTVVVGETQVFDYLYVIDLSLRYGNNDVVNAIIGNDSSKYVERLVKFDSNVLKNIALSTGSFSKCKSAKLKSNKFNQFMGNSTDSPQYIGHYYIDDLNGYSKIENANYNCFRIRVMPNTGYCLSKQDGTNLGASAIIRFVDINNNFISGDASGYSSTKIVVTTPVNCAYIEMQRYYTATATMNVNMSYDGSRDGEYEESDIMYVNLPNKDLNGILRVDGDGNIYADGDELYPNGVGNSKRFSDAEDLSTKTWSTSDGIHYTRLTNMTTSGSRALCTNYVYFSYNSIGSLSNLPRGGFTISSNYIYINSGDSNPTGTIFYKLATPQELSASTFDANIYQDDFGLTQVLDEDDNELNGLQGFEIFYKANIVAFTEMLYNKTDGDSDNLALKSELNEEATTRANQDTILQNTIGGTLRQCLCVKETLDFNNTKYVDLGSLEWVLQIRTLPQQSFFYAALDGNTTTKTNCLCTKYKTAVISQSDTDNDKVVALDNDGQQVRIRDMSYTGVDTFKNAMKGVLLAYEKA